MKELTVQATLDVVDEVTDFVNERLAEYGCTRRARAQIDIAIDELMSNIARYAYNPETGPATVRVEVTGEPLAATITFIDNGKPYDPLAKEDPDVTLKAADRPIGGLGIFMVKNIMDDIVYQYKEGKNILKIVKQIG